MRLERPLFSLRAPTRALRRISSHSRRSFFASHSGVQGWEYHSPPLPYLLSLVGGDCGDQPPLAAVFLRRARGCAGMVVPLAALAVLPLEGRGELDPLRGQLAAAVGADLVVQPEYFGGLTPLPRRATRSLPGAWQQIVYPFHPPPPLSPRSLAPPTPRPC